MFFHCPKDFRKSSFAFSLSLFSPISLKIRGYLVWGGHLLYDHQFSVLQNKIRDSNWWETEDDDGKSRFDRVSCLVNEWAKSVVGLFRVNCGPDQRCNTVLTPDFACRWDRFSDVKRRYRKDSSQPDKKRFGKSKKNVSKITMTRQA